MLKTSTFLSTGGVKVSHPSRREARHQNRFIRIDPTTMIRLQYFSALALTLICASRAFVPQTISKRSSGLSTLAAVTQDKKKKTTSRPAPAVRPTQLSGKEINQRLHRQLEKMRVKDARSPLLSKEVSYCLSVVSSVVHISNRFFAHT